MKLRVSDDLVLSADFVTSTQAILAQKGKGKSYTASVQAEELLAAGQQVVVVDPTGAWWGLRSSADGKSAGYSIAVLGGEHADVPLEATAGEVIADAIVTERFSAVIDLTLFRKNEALRFMAVFLETLYRRNREALHLFVDEADVIAPQKTFSPEQARCLGAAEDIVRRGRIRGIGCTLISQRAQVINKDVLSQVDMLTTLGMNHPKDIGAVDDWVAVHGDPKQAAKMIASLPALPKGEAWVWAPASDLFKRIHIRERRTFDSGKTPKAGERVAPPKVLAKVDLERLGVTIASSVQRVKENDPKELKKQVAELRLELDRVGKGQDRAEANEKTNHAENLELRIELEKLRNHPVLVKRDLDRLEKIVSRAEGAINKHDAAVSRHHQAYASALEGYTKVSKAVTSAVLVAVDDLRSKLQAASKSQLVVSPKSAVAMKPVVVKPTVRSNGMSHVNGAKADPTLQPAHLRILSSIAWWESIGVSAPDLVGVAFVAETSSTSSAFDNNRSRLRTAGYITYPSSGRVSLTEAGRVLARPREIPKTLAALHGVVLDAMQPALARLLKVLIAAYPGEVALEDLAEQAGTSTTSSAFDNNRSWLRARGLAEYPRSGFARATELLFPEAVS